jgi:hypothetical protein
MTLRAKKQMELALRVPLLSKLAPGEKPRGAPTYHQFRRDFAGPDTEVKPFENQMNNEHETSRISLHDFNSIGGRRSIRFLNGTSRTMNPNDCESFGRWIDRHHRHIRHGAGVLQLSKVKGDWSGGSLVTLVTVVTIFRNANKWPVESA